MTEAAIAAHGDLVVSSTVTNFGARSFAVASRKARNQLPAGILYTRSRRSAPLKLLLRHDWVRRDLTRRALNDSNMLWRDRLSTWLLLLLLKWHNYDELLLIYLCRTNWPTRHSRSTRQCVSRTSRCSGNYWPSRTYRFYRCVPHLCL